MSATIICTPANCRTQHALQFDASLPTDVACGREASIRSGLRDLALAQPIGTYLRVMTLRAADKTIGCCVTG